MARSRISATRLGLEFLSVTLAVFMGFTLNEWRTSRANDELADGALRAITAEIRFNERQITGRIAYFQDIVHQIDSLTQARPGRDIRFSDLSGWGGAAPPLLRTASYDAALASGAMAFIPFETTNSISTLYAMQDYVRHVSLSVIDRLMDPEALTVDSVGFLFRLYIDMTPELISVYDEIGSSLEAAGYGTP